MSIDVVRREPPPAPVPVGKIVAIELKNLFELQEPVVTLIQTRQAGGMGISVKVNGRITTQLTHDETRELIRALNEMEANYGK